MSQSTPRKNHRNVKNSKINFVSGGEPGLIFQQDTAQLNELTVSKTFNTEDSSMTANTQMGGTEAQ